ncbi:hypothetical protein [Thiolapillus sp.]|uniref:hypothetical protein n=1 Tax=Thiolapillus sp. TaxID=2017437 RepID=UPI003AF5E7C1
MKVSASFETTMPGNEFNSFVLKKKLYQRRFECGRLLAVLYKGSWLETGQCGDFALIWVRFSSFYCILMYLHQQKGQVCGILRIL